MRVRLQLATASDAADLVSLRVAVNQKLISQYGAGYWASGATEKGVLFAMRRPSVFIARHRGRLVATLAFSARKPWAIDKTYFHPGEKPLYLTGMAVDPDQQRNGIGRQCLDEARKIARKWPSDAIRLDAYDVEAGAGEFYRKCGFCEVGRAVYRLAPWIYFEMLLRPPQR